MGKRKDRWELGVSEKGGVGDKWKEEEKRIRLAGVVGERCVHHGVGSEKEGQRVSLILENA